MRLSVELTPDVPNPRDEEFISSLLDDQVDYQLTLRREASDTAVVLESHRARSRLPLSEGARCHSQGCGVFCRSTYAE